MAKVEGCGLHTFTHSLFQSHSFPHVQNHTQSLSHTLIYICFMSCTQFHIFYGDNFLIQGPTNFNQTCQLLAFLVPRVSDPSALVRIQAVGSVFMVLRIAGQYTGLSHDHQDEDLEVIKVSKESHLYSTLKNNFSCVLPLLKIQCRVHMLLWCFI